MCSLSELGANDREPNVKAACQHLLLACGVVSFENCHWESRAILKALKEIAEVYALKTSQTASPTSSLATNVANQRLIVSDYQSVQMPNFGMISNEGDIQKDVQCGRSVGKIERAHV